MNIHVLIVAILLVPKLTENHGSLASTSHQMETPLSPFIMSHRQQRKKSDKSGSPCSWRRGRDMESEHVPCFLITISEAPSDTTTSNYNTWSSSSELSSSTKSSVAETNAEPSSTNYKVETNPTINSFSNQQTTIKTSSGTSSSACNPIPILELAKATTPIPSNQKHQEHNKDVRTASKKRSNTKKKLKDSTKKNYPLIFLPPFISFRQTDSQFVETNDDKLLSDDDRVDFSKNVKETNENELSKSERLRLLTLGKLWRVQNLVKDKPAMGNMQEKQAQEKEENDRKQPPEEIEFMPENPGKLLDKDEKPWKIQEEVLKEEKNYKLPFGGDEIFSKTSIGKHDKISKDNIGGHDEFPNKEALYSNDSSEKHENNQFQNGEAVFSNDNKGKQGNEALFDKDNIGKHEDVRLPNREEALLGNDNMIIHENDKKPFRGESLTRYGNKERHDNGELHNGGEASFNNDKFAKRGELPNREEALFGNHNFRKDENNKLLHEEVEEINEEESNDREEINDKLTNGEESLTNNENGNYESDMIPYGGELIISNDNTGKHDSGKWSIMGELIDQNNNKFKKNDSDMVLNEGELMYLINHDIQRENETHKLPFEGTISHDNIGKLDQDKKPEGSSKLKEGNQIKWEGEKAGKALKENKEKGIAGDDKTKENKEKGIAGDVKIKANSARKELEPKENIFRFKANEGKKGTDTPNSPEIKGSKIATKARQKVERQYNHVYNPPNVSRQYQSSNFSKVESKDSAQKARGINKQLTGGYTRLRNHNSYKRIHDSQVAHNQDSHLNEKDFLLNPLRDAVHLDSYSPITLQEGFEDGIQNVDSRKLLNVDSGMAGKYRGLYKARRVSGDDEEINFKTPFDFPREDSKEEFAENLQNLRNGNKHIKHRRRARKQNSRQKMDENQEVSCDDNPQKSKNDEGFSGLRKGNDEDQDVLGSDDTQHIKDEHKFSGNHKTHHNEDDQSLLENQDGKKVVSKDGRQRAEDVIRKDEELRQNMEEKVRRLNEKEEVVATGQRPNEISDVIKLIQAEPTEAPGIRGLSGNVLLDANIKIGNGLRDLLNQMLTPGQKTVRITEDSGKKNGTSKMVWLMDDQRFP